MKRLVIDARESGTSTGRYVDKLIENLSKLKPELDVIVLAKTARVDFLQHLAPNFKVVKSDHKEFGIGEQLGLLRQLRGLSPDLVHFTMTQQPILYSGKKITTIHDLTTIRFDNPAKNFVLFKFKQLVYKGVIKRAAQTADSIITPSEYVKQDVAQYAKIPKSKVQVTYEAADRIHEPPRAVPRLEGKQFIMYVGRATPHKNLARLVKAFALLRKAHPELMLVFAGQMDPNYKRLEAMVSARRLADKVVFTDYVTEGELRWLYQNTAAYIFPSLSEGFGLPGLEAMAHGAPVICAKATCLPEVYGDAAIYFEPRDVRDMATKIHRLLTNSKLRTSLVIKGRAQAVKYSWRRMAQQTLKIYEDSLK